MNKYYPFELHCHTFHSDGSMSPEMLVNSAIGRGYSGIAITDHNTMSGAEAVREKGEKQGLTVLKGVEWTTFFGHIVCISEENLLDWREFTKDNIDEKLKFAYESGAIITLAHPRRMGKPVCIGCHMEFPITQYQYVTAIEVWSQKDSPESLSNIAAVQYYDSLLTQGFNLSAVYGYDWHGIDTGYENFFRTYIGADTCSEIAIKNALKAGDTYISPGVEIVASVDGKRAKFGSYFPCGNHFFNVELDRALPQNITLESTKYIGSALKSTVETPFGEQVNIGLCEGWLRIECTGSIGKEKSALIFTSPFYII